MNKPAKKAAKKAPRVVFGKRSGRFKTIDVFQSAQEKEKWTGKKGKKRDA